MVDGQALARGMVEAGLAGGGTSGSWRKGAQGNARGADWVAAAGSSTDRCRRLEAGGGGSSTASNERPAAEGQIRVDGQGGYSSTIH